MYDGTLKYKEFLPFLYNVYNKFIFNNSHRLFNNFINYNQKDYEIRKLRCYHIPEFISKLIKEINLTCTNDTLIYTKKDGSTLNEKLHHIEKATMEIGGDISECLYVDIHCDLFDKILEDQNIIVYKLDNTSSNYIYNFLNSLDKNDAKDFVDNCIIDAIGCMDEYGTEAEFQILEKYNM
jgi:hypothetical protein